MKSVQIQGFFCSIFSHIRTEYGEIQIISLYTEYLSVFSPNVGKYGPEKTLYLDTLHAVFLYLGSYPGSIPIIPDKFVFMEPGTNGASEIERTWKAS